MTRPIILGNGNMLVCIDKHSRIRDFYYPYVGQENHVSSNRHRIGVWVDNDFSWVSEETWDLAMGYKKDSLVSEVVAYNDTLKVELTISEAVHFKKNILLRKVDVKNEGAREREIRVFFSQHFQISEANIGDTVYYNPILESIINYKGRRYFLIGGMADKKSFTDYATGNSWSSDRDGTWRDAEDGVLSKNSIEHGTVDSTIGFSLKIKSKESKPIDYWIAVGEKHKEVRDLKNFIVEKSVTALIKETEEYWIRWVNQKKIDFHHLGSPIRDLFFRSLLIVRAQTDNHGAIIAANDTHTFHNKKDTYSYMWPRDGALIARSFDKVGHHGITERFFEFCSGLLSDDGYLLHKYRPDGSLGSSWHPWLKGNRLQLPIQEDETALILDAIWKHYNRHKDNSMIKRLYKKFIKPAGDFLLEFRDPQTKLPKESYDLWEEKLGVHTFTCCTVYAGLEAAKNFAEIFGNKSNAKAYGVAANEVREAIIKNLYDEGSGVFIKRIYYDDSCYIDGKDCTFKKDKTVDSSTAYGLFEYNVLDINDPRLERTMNLAIEKLWNTHGCRGMARYSGDLYYRISRSAPENPWFISTMWLAEYYISKAKTVDDLKKAEDLLYWASDRALLPGTLSEQLNPYTGGPLSVAPLTWSHAGFIIAVVKYLDKFEKLKSEG